MAKKKLEQPSLDSERLLDEILGDSVELVSMRGRKKSYPVRWMKPGTMRKLTHIMLAKDNDAKVSCMSAALIILNDFWRIKFLYPILWRWFFYIKQYTDDELFPIIAAGKKKVPAKNFFMNITLLTEMKDTIMIMKKEEATISLPEPFTEPGGNQIKVDG